MRRPRHLVFTPVPINPPFASPFRHTSTKLLTRLTTTLASIPAPPIIPRALQISSSVRIVQVRGDGRCLYRAIAKNLAALENRRLPEHLERADADALRNMAWRAICVDRASEFERKHVVEGSLSAYCRAMRAPTFYAGEAEMLALADVLRVPIRVFIDVGRGNLKNVVTYGDKYAKGRSSGVRVLFVNGNHYNAILPR